MLFLKWKNFENKLECFFLLTAIYQDLKIIQKLKPVTQNSI